MMKSNGRLALAAATISALAATALGAPQHSLGFGYRSREEPAPAVKYKHGPVHKFRDTKKACRPRYKGSNAAKRATRRGGNPAAQR